MLIAYLDESQSDNLFTIAGFLSDVDQWKRLEKEWGKCLREYEAPYLHMKELAHFKGPYENWSESKRRAFLEKLCWIIKRSAKVSIAATLSVKDYEGIVGNSKNRKHTPYYHCFRACLSGALIYCSDCRDRDKVAVICDERQKTKFHAQEIFVSFKQTEEIPNCHQLDTLTFANDKDYPALQAADFLAYEVSSFHRGKRRAAMKELSDMKRFIFFITKEDLLNHVKFLKVDRLKRLPRESLDRI